MSRSTICYVHKLAMDKPPGYRYAHAFRNAFATHLAGKEHPILKVRVVELSEETDDAYWAWWNAEDGCFHHVYPKKLLVEMCFPYGTQPETERGYGELLPVSIEELGMYTVEEAKAKEWRP